MSITVANLMAQVGADLTQFRLGMNEVDARINQVKTRSAAGIAAVQGMRNEAVRLNSAASADATKKAIAAATAAAGKAAMPLLKKQLADAQAELTKAEAAMTAIGSKKTATNAKSFAAAEKEVALRRAAAADAKRDYADTERQVKSLTKAVDTLGRSEERNRRRAAGLVSGSNFREDLNAASTAVATAYANRLKQNSNEHRVRALNTISGTVENVGLMGAAGLATAVKVGGDFNQMMVTMAHNTQLSADGVKIMSDTVKELGQENGGDLKDIAESFRILTDYGNNATNSQNMLRVAMKASVATGAELSTVTDLLAASTKEFNLPVGSAATTMNVMVEASRHSTLTMQKMVVVAGQLYATAANLGVSFIDANAALITFTQHGLSATQAAVQLRNDISKITQPTAGVVKWLKAFDGKFKTGLTADFTQAGLRARGLLGVWNDIVKAAQKAGVRPTELAQKAFPNQRGTIGGIIATGTGLQDMARNHAMLAGFANGQQSNALNSAYQESLNQLNVQFDKLKNSAIILAGGISTVLTPTIINLVRKIDNGIHSFQNLDTAQKETWTKMAVGGSVALITFGAVGKLIVGITALNTALIEMRGVGLLGTIRVFGPYVAALVAAAVAVAYLVSIYNKLDAAHVITGAEMSANIDKNLAAAQASNSHAQQVMNLINEYKKLESQHIQTHKSLDKMQGILNQISLLSPDLITGYNLQGNAIMLVGDAAAKTATQLQNMARANVLAASAKIDTQMMDVADQRAHSADDIKRAQYSIKTGMFPDKIDKNGSYQWYLPSKAELDRNANNPYLSSDDNSLNSLFGDSNGWKLPKMHKGTPQDYQDAANMTRTQQSLIAQKTALMARYGADATKILKNGLPPMPVHIGGADPYGANHIPGLVPPDKLAGLGGKDKGDSAAKKAVDAWKSRVREANDYIDSLKKKNYELRHVGELASTEWEIQAGRLKGMGTHYANVAKTLAAWNLQLEINKRLSDATAMSKLAGHDDIKAAIGLSGGQDVWNQMSSIQKANAVRTASSNSMNDSLYDMNESYKKRAQESLHPIRTASDEAEASIQEFADKMHRSVNDPEFAKMITNIKTWAGAIDTAAINAYTKAQKRGIYDQSLDLRSQVAGEQGQKDYAYQKWLADNADHLATMPASRRATFTAAMRKGMDGNFDLAREVEVQKQVNDLVESTRRKTMEIKTIDPFETWLNDMRVFNRDKGVFELPKLMNGRPMDISTARSMYDLQAQNTLNGKIKDQMQALGEEAAAMRESDPFKVWAQSYETFDQRMNNGRGGFQALGAANTKALRDLYDYQTKIDLMKKASEGLTGVIVGAINDSYGKGFGGFFERIKAGFQRMLFDMAVQLLQSRLMQMLQSKLFGAAGGNAGVATSLGGSILGVASLFGGGTVGKGVSAASNLLSVAAPGPSSFGSYAARAMGGPMSAGNAYIVGERGPELVVPRSAGWVYPNNQTRQMGGDSGHMHVYNISINTPDAGSFHRSAGAVLDEMHKSAARAHARAR